MGGVLSHLALALITANVVHLRHFRLEFSMAALLGNLAPDAVKFGLSGVFNGTMNLARIVKTGSYSTIQPVADSVTSWFTLGFFILALSIFLFHHHIIRKKKMEEYDELVVFFIIGVVLHLLLDYFYQEQSAWL